MLAKFLLEAEVLVLSNQGRKKINKHKQLRGIVPEMGGGQIVYVFPFFPMEKGKHINKIPRKSQEKAGRVPGQSRDNPGTIP